MTQESIDSALVLLAGAFRARRTGLLVVGEAPGALRIRLESGQIVAMGPVQAEAAAEAPMPKPSDSVRLRLERVLAEIGMRKPLPAIDPPPPASSASLRDRLIERLADASQPGSFEEGRETPPDLLAVVVATEPLILEAVRQMRSDVAVRAALGDLDQPLVATTALVDERTLTLVEGYLLSRIDGLVSARHVLEITPLDPQESERTLLGLVLTGRVERRPAPAARHEPRPAADEAAPEAMAPPSPEPQPEPSPQEAGADAEVEADETVPEPQPESGAFEEPVVADADEVIEAVPVEDVVAVPVEDDAEAFAADAQAAEPTPTMAAQRVDVALLERRREILEFFQSLPVKNHFEVLGVEAGCDDADVRRAYVALAKRYHPDARRDRSLEDLHDILEAIFIRVGEAWEVLGEAKSRASYEARSGIVRRPRPVPTAQPPAPPPPPAAPDASGPASVPPAASAEPPEYVPPEETLYRARQLLVQARYWEAIQVLESALPGMEPRSQQHRGRLLLARAYAKNPNWLRRAEETLHQLMREDPTNADAHYELGLVYKAGGFVERAKGMFRRAVELRPRHKGASAELGILDPEAGGGAGGLLKRLFKRGKAS